MDDKLIKTPRLFAPSTILRDIRGDRILPKKARQNVTDLRTDKIPHGFYAIEPAPEHRRDLPKTEYCPDAK